MKATLDCYTGGPFFELPGQVANKILWDFFFKWEGAERSPKPDFFLLVSPQELRLVAELSRWESRFLSHLAWSASSLTGASQ